MSKFITFCIISIFALGYADNQTPTVDVPLPGSELPFTLSVETADFALPQGLQSYVFAIHKNKALLFAGLTGGLHDFYNVNKTAYVFDLWDGSIVSRSLEDPVYGLTTDQINTICTTNPQFFKDGNRLYITGGYGQDNITKNCLTAVDVKEMIEWVMHPTSSIHLSSHIRQLFDDRFEVTGGKMYKGDDGLVLLIFGANIVNYFDVLSYTEQVRRFIIHDNGKKLSVTFKDPLPLVPDPNYRRRDLNIEPIIQKRGIGLKPAYVALSGVFTETQGVWTVPVLITKDGKSSMADPVNPNTFKQGMNNYDCASAQLFSRKSGDMYILLFGGISYGYFQNGTFQEDPNFPFINQITTVRIDKEGHFSQYIMAAEFPLIRSQTVNPGNPLFFGADAYFFPAVGVKQYFNKVLSFDALCKDKQFIGYIIGGIQSTLPDTGLDPSLSGASPYIFKVYLKQKQKCPCREGFGNVCIGF